MIRVTEHVSKRLRYCDGCHPPHAIRPGERYVEHVASPWAPDGLGVGRWTRLIECAESAARHGRHIAGQPL